ncbi:MAG: type 2 isopentenyl-diphosphate Delta-isomerase, partial [Candidatus Izemoplasmataceae bacterium]
MNKKDDHIRYALNQEITTNDFDALRFVPNSIPKTDVHLVDLSVDLFNQTFPYPIYINAMTGGTEKAYAINKSLAQIAKHFNFMIASGSLSQAIKDPKTSPSFTILRETFKEGFILANIGISAPLDYCDKAIDLLNANAIQIHINAPQEIIMPEGDRIFHDWLTNLNHHAKHVKVPIIAKETGFGMSRETIEMIQLAGIKTIDVSGRGGTNFIAIENNRRKRPLKSFES